MEEFLRKSYMESIITNRELVSLLKIQDEKLSRIKESMHLLELDPEKVGKELEIELGIAA